MNDKNAQEKAAMLPSEVRTACRAGILESPTTGLALDYVQANLVIVPRGLAYDFLVFCQRNPKPCPLLEVTDMGDPEPKLLAPGADVRTDLPRYRLYRNGEMVAETGDIIRHWCSDFVTFLLGCSFTFEGAMLAANLPVRHIEEKVNVPMYVTNIPCRSAGLFSGPLVVSMRPLTPAQAIAATQITARYPRVHGAPVHVGPPGEIGIADLSKPEFGDPVTIRQGEIPVFWACGVTPQAAIMAAKPEFAITHAPGHMFVTDIKNEEMAL
jgi:uncharacterized protein YcsI (UPF0317 family)